MSIGTRVRNKQTKEDKLERAVKIARALDAVGDTTTLRVLGERTRTSKSEIRTRLESEGLLHVIGVLS